MRIERGWSQGQLAKKIDTNLQRISKYECDIAYPTTDMMVKLASAFQVSMEGLSHGGNLEPTTTLPPTPEWLNRIEEVNKLPKSDQKVIMSLMDAYIKQRKFNEFARKEF